MLSAIHSMPAHEYPLILKLSHKNTIHVEIYFRQSCWLQWGLSRVIDNSVDKQYQTIINYNTNMVFVQCKLTDVAAWSSWSLFMQIFETQTDFTHACKISDRANHFVGNLGPQGGQPLVAWYEYIWVHGRSWSHGCIVTCPPPKRASALQH